MLLGFLISSCEGATEFPNELLVLMENCIKLITVSNNIMEALDFIHSHFISCGTPKQDGGILKS